jgi:putative tricarboxylic transport membrane protein
MAIDVRNPRDFWSGVIFAVVGLAAVGLGREIPMGTATKMGPGYFPTILGVLLALIGLVLVARALVTGGGAVGRLALLPVACVLGGTVLFGVLVRGTGLVVALVLLVLISAAASRLVRWGQAALLAIGLAAVSALVFVKLLGLPILLVGRWFGG